MKKLLNPLKKKVGPIAVPLTEINGEFYVPVPDPIVQSLDWKSGLRLRVVPVEKGRLLVEKAPAVKTVLPMKFSPGIRKFLIIIFLVTVFLVMYGNGASLSMMLFAALIMLLAAIVL